MDPAELPGAVRRAAAGEAVLPGMLARRVVEELRRRGGASRSVTVDHSLRVDITPREGEVLDLLGQGLGTAAVAERLGLAPVTVRRHISMLEQRLGVRSRRSSSRSPGVQRVERKMRRPADCAGRSRGGMVIR